MRKTMFWCSLITAALCGSACKQDRSEKASEQVRKSVEEVQEQRKDVAKEQKDMAKEQQDMAKEQRDLAKAEGNLAQARANYVTAMRERLAAIDAKIGQLEARADAKVKDAAITLRARRNELANKVDSAEKRADSEWDRFRSDLDDTFKKVEADVKDALH